MNQDQTKIFVKNEIENYLAAKGINIKKPFNCLNPEHADNDPSMSYDTKRKKVHCFSCGADYDTFDLIGIDYNLSASREIFKKAYEYFNIYIENDVYKSSKKQGQNQVKNEQKNKEFDMSNQNDYTEYFLKAKEILHKSPEALEYIKGRGISLETADQFILGFDPEWRSPAAIRNGKNPLASARLIIPTSRQSYLARAIDKNIDPKYKAMKEGTSELFNKKALQGATPVFVTEGEIDALSIIEIGGEALGLGSINNVNKLLELCKSEHPAIPLILSLDNDERGKEAQLKLKLGLEDLKISFFEVNTAGDYKDPNEHLVKNKEAFTALVNSDPAEAARQEAEAEKIKYLETAAAYHLNALMGEIAASANTPAISTGFKLLDEALDGGLYEGLYIIGAISSLGKTTFVLQIADQIAQRGNDVLIFSLEMSRYELMAKSISRLTLENCGGKTTVAKTTRGILAGAKRKNYSTEEKELINKSIADYAEYSQYIYIHEGIGNIGVEEIRHEVQKHISFTGNTPLVIIDYLQIISPFDMKSTDKQNTDKTVLELKRLSRDKKIPVIAISSFNRDNYTAPVNLASYKESGAIEYSSDILLGLQLAGMDELSQSEGKRTDTTKKIEEMKVADPRKAQLKILKNRNGKIGISLYYDYYPMFNMFKESVTPEENDKDWNKKGGSKYAGKT
ncbi:MAG: toprim domain-containing protein [Endomicrobia bacterium]|nr:toprim domain-containing protein [Endomicrobiia bacterium]